jgi:hypothetical protein
LPSLHQNLGVPLARHDGGGLSDTVTGIVAQSAAAGLGLGLTVEKDRERAVFFYLYTRKLI